MMIVVGLLVVVLLVRRHVVIGNASVGALYIGVCQQVTELERQVEWLYQTDVEVVYAQMA